MMFASAFVSKNCQREKTQRNFDAFVRYGWRTIVARQRWRHQNFSDDNVDTPQCWWSQWALSRDDDLNAFALCDNKRFERGVFADSMSQKANYEHLLSFRHSDAMRSVDQPAYTGFASHEITTSTSISIHFHCKFTVHNNQICSKLLVLK